MYIPVLDQWNVFYGGKGCDRFFRCQVAGNFQGENWPLVREQAQGREETVAATVHVSWDNDPIQYCDLFKYLIDREVRRCQQHSRLGADELAALIDHILFAEVLGIIPCVWQGVVY